MNKITTIKKSGETDMDYIQTICKMGQGGSCCRYLVVGSTEFECAKESSLKKTIVFRVDQMVSKRR